MSSQNDVALQVFRFKPFVRNDFTMSDEEFHTPSSGHKSSRRMSVDEIQMNEMGYEQELARGLDGFKNFAFGFTEVCLAVFI
jgi:hypothetical protein